MHKSRLCAVVIDCRGDDLEAAAQFWSAALGRPISEREGKYVNLADRPGQPITLVQKVDHSSRVHLDIESDDVEREVDRLVALGAKRIEKIHTWWVLEAPTGQRFCVVRPQRGALGEDANIWGGAHESARDPRKEDEQGIRTVLAELTAAWREGRFEDLEPLFTEEVVFVAPAGRITGRAACADTYRQFAQAVSIETYEESDLQIDLPSDGTAMASYRWKMRWSRGGLLRDETGEDLLALSRRDGVWRVTWRRVLVDR